MKKLLLTLGTVAAVAAPVASVIACGTTTNEKSALNSLNKDELDKNFHNNYGVLAEATSELAGELLTGKDDTAKTATVKVLKFTFNGQKGEFDFTKDKFLHNGLTSGMKAPIDSLTKAYPSVDKLVGEYPEYVKSTDPVVISSTEGLSINSTWLAEYKRLEDAAKAKHPKGETSAVSVQTPEDTALHAQIDKLESKLRYIIRMAVAAKTDLHIDPTSGSWVDTTPEAA